MKVKNGKRDDLRKFLESKKIPSMIYYPGPLHIQEAYRYLGYSECLSGYFSTMQRGSVFTNAS
jgi:dTDP-4-amino-4,6-dideoxygalactose transaminase